MASDAVDSVLIDEGATAHYVVPVGSIAGWNTASFDDTDWLLGPTGIGYETSPADYDDFIETAIDPGPSGSRPTTMYVRQTFDVSDLELFDTFLLQVRYDDGFVAYLNGVEVARANAPSSPQWDSSATASHSDTAAVLFESFNVSEYSSHLQPTDNVLAIQLLNINRDSSDLLLEPRLVASQTSFVPDELGFMADPTPGEPNSEAFLGFVEDTKFSVDLGFFETAFDVEITTTTVGAMIVYTTDATAPDVDDALNITNGQFYSGPLHIDSTTTLRAAAFVLGYRPSNTDTHTYLYLDDVVVQSPGGQTPAGFPSNSINGQVFDYGMDPNITNDPVWGPQLDDALTQIPSLSIVTDGDNLFDPSMGIYVNAGGHGRAWERPTSLELIQPDGTTGFQIDAGLRIRGGFSRGDFNPKHSFRLFFRSEYGDAKLRYPLFGEEGVDEFDSVDLRTAQNYAWSNDTFNDQLQNTFLRDIYSRDLQREFGHAYTRGRFYHLYLNGQYWGLYQTEERPEASYASSYFGGTKEEWDAVKASGGHIEATDGDLAAWSTLSSLANAGFDTDAAYYFIQGRNPDGSLNQAYQQHVDIDNLVDFMIGVFFTGNQDMPTSLGDGGPNNFWAVRPRDGSHGWRWIAHDNEHNLGTSRDGDPKDDNVFYDETAPTSTGGSASSFNPKYLHQQLTRHPEYRTRFGDRVQRAFFNEGPLTTANAQGLLDSRSIQISQAIIAESARWGDQHNEPPLTWNTWSTEVDWLRDFFLAQRSDIVLDQLRSRGLYPNVLLDAPSFSQHGGVIPAGYQLAITNHETAGTIYYTLDGSDPRSMGGDVAGAAVPYAGEISLVASTTVKARLRRGAVWSALVEADFLVGVVANSTNTRVTELNYNPHAAFPQFGELNVDNERFEFIELVNFSQTDTVDLKNSSFAAGIDFSFDHFTPLSPGERILVVRDVAAFESRYGSGLPIAGIFQNDTGLSNSGETIRLDDATGSTIVEFTYDDRGDWPTRADGPGSSLVVRDAALTDPETDWNAGENWRASTAFGGTPGTAAVNTIDVIVNEVLAHTNPPATDTIELYNTSTETVDLSGWLVSDSSGDYFKYTFSPGSTLAGGEYLVLDEQDFNPGGGSNATDFALSAGGDEVWLLEPDTTGKPLRFADTVSFDATLAGISVGRVPNGDPRYELFPLTGPTLGGPNEPHAPGDVILSEIHYHPAAPPPGSTITELQLEFVELYNRSGAALDLSGWQIQGAVELELPSGTSLAAGEVLVLVPFDPQDSVLASEFRTIHQMSDTVRLIGPYLGLLKNGGESVRLQAPTAPPVGEPGPVYYLVDRVTYDDQSPWPPSADGTGDSLSRVTAEAFGDESTNWLASLPTPGSVSFLPAHPADFDGNGQVDGNDFLTWQTGFGQFPGGGAAPATAMPTETAMWTAMIFCFGSLVSAAGKLWAEDRLWQAPRLLTQGGF